MKIGRGFVFALALLCFGVSMSAGAEPGSAAVSDPQIGSQTRECIECHRTITPGIVEDWLSSRHSRVTPGDAMKKPALERRISAEKIPPELSGVVVGCFECHSRNPEAHKDNFEHFGFKINVIVSPNDCNTCHPVEVKQFSDSKKAHASKNLRENPLYHTLINTITGVKKVEKGKLIPGVPSEDTLGETCFGCHGTRIEVQGMKTVDSEIGEVSVPVLRNWPNQGVGRENPDGSLGACTACHPRHSFSLEVARKPYTCAQCHIEPDVPAWDVYKESKHGNLFFSSSHDWNFDAVPWVVGRDFKSPTCAACHNSLLVSPDGSVIRERTHDFGSRLWVRLFGLIYSHPQPKSGNTTIIRNKEGLPLPTTFRGEPASEFLIDGEEGKKREDSMKKLCVACHSSSWTDGHFAKLRNSIRETDEMTLAATNLMTEAWEKRMADRTNPFDEALEQLWVRQWLFYANTVRYASAMGGAYGLTSFKNGWWELTNTLTKMKESMDLKERGK